MSKKQNYQRESMEKTQDRDHAIALLKEMEPLIRPYNAQMLGSFSFHLFAQRDPQTGLTSVGFVTACTELDIKADMLNKLLPAFQDSLLQVIGGEKMNVGPKTVGEQEEMNEQIRDMGLVPPT